jgi:hypothetical protein
MKLEDKLEQKKELLSENKMVLCCSKKLGAVGGEFEFKSGAGARAEDNVMGCEREMGLQGPILMRLELTVHRAFAASSEESHQMTTDNPRDGWRKLVMNRNVVVYQ